MASSALRVLVTGNVDGNVTQLLDRVSGLSKKAPFDLLLVTGDLFPEEEQEDNVDLSWIDLLLEDDVKYQNLPQSIYILGPRTVSQKKMYHKLWKASNEVIEDEETAFKQGFEILNGKFTVLGSRGIMTCATGLTIAYFNGCDKVSQDEIEEFLITVNSQSVIDVLMTSSWPKGIHRHCGTSPPPEIVTASENGSQVIVNLVTRVQPRYHFTPSPNSLPGSNSSPGIYFERQPYRNHVVLSETNKPVTRFISLAPVTGVKKGPKWLYAFNIKPASCLLKQDKESHCQDGRKELCNQPQDTTEIPFHAMNLKPQNEENVQFFYSQSSKNNQGDEQVRKESRNNNERNKNERNPEGHNQERRRKQNQVFDSSNCWFCLSSANVQKSLVVSIGEHCYLATAKGGLVNEHLLILPIEHIRSILECQNSQLVSEVDKFKESLVKYFSANENQLVAFFERNFKSQHLQIQVVPFPRTCLMKDKQGREMLSETIKQLIADQDLEFEIISQNETLHDFVNPGNPYFYFEIPEINLKIYIKINVSKRRRLDGDKDQDAGGDNDQEERKLFPLQIGRQIMAEVLGLEATFVNWKDVSLSDEEESKRAANFRTKYQPFDFTLE